jgi:hypothetical protein
VLSIPPAFALSQDQTLRFITINRQSDLRPTHYPKPHKPHPAPTTPRSTQAKHAATPTMVTQGSANHASTPKTSSHRQSPNMAINKTRTSSASTDLTVKQQTRSSRRPARLGNPLFRVGRGFYREGRGPYPLPSGPSSLSWLRAAPQSVVPCGEAVFMGPEPNCKPPITKMTA